jgi:rhodanese-related sulfurtransferase
VAQALLEDGFVDVHLMTGGFEAWREAGHPFEPKRAVA